MRPEAATSHSSNGEPWLCVVMSSGLVDFDQFGAASGQLRGQQPGCKIEGPHSDLQPSHPFDDQRPKAAFNSFCINSRPNMLKTFWRCGQMDPTRCYSTARSKVPHPKWAASQFGCSVACDYDKSIWLVEAAARLWTLRGGLGRCARVHES